MGSRASSNDRKSSGDDLDLLLQGGNEEGEEMSQMIVETKQSPIMKQGV